VVVAKVLAVLLLALAAVVVALALAAVGNALGQRCRTATATGPSDWSAVRDILLLQLLGVLQGSPSAC
jgi:hypothetical protein